MRRFPPIFHVIGWLALLSLWFGASGCADSPQPAETQQPAARAVAAQAVASPKVEAADSDAAAPAASADSASSPTPQPAYKVAGMVGQVNGQAIYADDVFEPMHEQLRALGQSLSRQDFRQRAEVLIRGRLDQIMTDSLILGEAQRDLSERERQGLKRIMQHRAKN